MSNLPTGAKDRKEIPLYRGLLKYFPDALAEVAKVSLVGNRQHGHTDDNIFWERGKSNDHLDSALRHMVQAEEKDIDGLYHAAKLAWRSLAHLQLLIEQHNKNEVKH